MNQSSENSEKLHFPGKLLKMLSSRWRDQSISAKFSCTFGLMLALILLLSFAGCFSLLFVRHKTETVIQNSTQIRELVLKMDTEMQSARRLEKEFFLQYPHIGFSQAFRMYGQESTAHIEKVVALSGQLQQAIARSNAGQSLHKSDVNLNFYLSAADRYSLIFLQTLSLVEKLAGKDQLQDQLHRHAVMIEQSPYIQENPPLLAAYRQMRIFEKDWFITRQRSAMQAAFNICSQLLESAQNAEMENRNSKDYFLSSLDNYMRTAEEIIRVDAEIHSKVREFDLQAKALVPISGELVFFSEQEMKNAGRQISAIYRWMTGILACAALTGLTLTLMIFRILDQSITRNILTLTEAAQDWGKTRMKVQISSGDELGHLARTFNDMSERLHAFIHHLEQKVEERTAQLSHSNAELQKEIQERKHAEEEMRTAKEAAEQASRVKSEFLANLSHEIRTPMNAILGFADILDTMIADIRQKEYLDSLRISAQSLLRLITDILELSKAEAGKTEIQCAPVSPARILKDTSRMFSHEIQRKNLDFLVKTAPDLPESLLLDEIRMRHVLLHLVGNAVKFTEKGSICVEVRTEALPEEVNETPAVRLIIAVKDTGIGIADDEHEHIFEMFARSSGKHGTGTGLGLSLTRRLTEMMGGKIAVESAWGRGSVFTVTFDRVELAGKRKKETQEEKEQDGENPCTAKPGDSFPAVSIRNGSQLLADMKKLMPKWQDLSETMFIDSIEELAAEAQKLGTAYNWNSLSAWAEDLNSRVCLFDIENLPAVMEKFPAFVHDLEKQIQSKSGA